MPDAVDRLDVTVVIVFIAATSLSASLRLHLTGRLPGIDDHLLQPVHLSLLREVEDRHRRSNAPNRCRLYVGRKCIDHLAIADRSRRPILRDGDLCGTRFQPEQTTADVVKWLSLETHLARRRIKVERLRGRSLRGGPMENKQGMDFEIIVLDEVARPLLDQRNKPEYYASLVFLSGIDRTEI
jgi:hypothetical protein